MEKFASLLDRLEEELLELESQKTDVLVYAETGMKISKNYLNELRGQFENHSFISEADECCFFKSIKPHAVSKLIYYLKLFNIESKRPRSSKKAQKRYLQAAIDKLQNYFNENFEFYQYYRRKATNLDKHFFLRRKANMRLHPDHIHFITDANFSTSHDESVATIMAYDMLIVYLQQEIETLCSRPSGMAIKKNLPQVTWSRNKVDLIELIYALHSTQAINAGMASINEIATLFERIFNIELGDYYRTYLELRSRKMNQLKFLDALKSALQQRMYDADE